MSQELFNHMSNEHNVILLESEMQEIKRLCKEDRIVKVPKVIFYPVRLLTVVLIIPSVFIALQFQVLKAIYLICYNHMMHGGEYIAYQKNYTINESYDKIQDWINRQ